MVINPDEKTRRNIQQEWRKQIIKDRRDQEALQKSLEASPWDADDLKRSRTNTINVVAQGLGCSQVERLRKSSILPAGQAMVDDPNKMYLVKGTPKNGLS